MSSEIGVPPPSDGVATLQSDTEAARKEKLRVAGEEYFQRILAQTGTANLPPRSTKERLSGPALSVPGYDPDLEQIGGIVEGARTYLLGTLFVISQAASIVFIKGSLIALPVPALLAAAHLLVAVCALLALSGQGVISLPTPSGRALMGALPSAAIYGLQALFLFSSALHASVYVVLCWTTVVPHLLAAAARALVLRRAPPPLPVVTGLAAGSLAIALALLRTWPGVSGLLSLALWAVAQAASMAWSAVVKEPEVLLQAAGGGGRHGVLVQQLAEAESSVGPSMLALLQQGLPAVPLLLLGLAFSEGRELAAHELSVPAVTMFSGSALAFAVGVAGALLLLDSLPRHARAALQAAGPFGAVVTEAAVHGLGSPLGFVAAAAAAVVGLLLRLADAAAA